jgi:hypothetical protein
MSEIMSIYVANVFEYSKEEIIVFFERSIGRVRRVDFFENEDMPHLSAMVHLHVWYESEFAYQVYYDILGPRESHLFYLDDTKYLILRRMTCPPVPDTVLNIHQIAQEQKEHSLILEELREIISSQNLQIQSMLSMMDAHGVNSDKFVANEFHGRNSAYTFHFSIPPKELFATLYKILSSSDQQLFVSWSVSGAKLDVTDSCKRFEVVVYTDLHGSGSFVEFKRFADFKKLMEITRLDGWIKTIMKYVDVVHRLHMGVRDYTRLYLTVPTNCTRESHSFVYEYIPEKKFVMRDGDGDEGPMTLDELLVDADRLMATTDLCGNN